MAAGALDYQSDDGGGGVISDINVTPLVDITLVLLIIFMVTARLIAARAIPVDTPKTVSGTEVATSIELTIQPEGQVFINGEPAADMQAVSDYMRSAVAKDRNVRPVVTADARVPHGDVMAVVDVVKGAGATRFAVATDAKGVP